MKCIIIEDELISVEIITEFVNQTKSLELLGSFSTAREALEYCRLYPKEVELMILDIGLPDISGLDLLESLSNPPQVIIISGSEKHALASYKYEITDYILKPVSYGRFFIAVNKALNRNAEKHGEQCEYYNSCPIFFGRLIGKETTINVYRKQYCTNGVAGKSSCRRFQTNTLYGKCPPDLLPNSESSLAEIGEKYHLKERWQL
jgi:two-component SAPR family response regulator